MKHPHYTVFLSDLRKKSDTEVVTNLGRKQARRLVRELNAKIVQLEPPRDGLPLPLYFADKDQ